MFVHVQIGQATSGSWNGGICINFVVDVNMDVVDTKTVTFEINFHFA